MPEENIIEINFESRRFKKLEDADTFYQYVTNRVEKANGKVYLFLDEIQHVTEWHLSLIHILQNPSHQLFTEDVLDEVLLSMDGDEEENRPIAEKILSDLNLTPFTERHPMSLSGGQQQRVAVASAVASGREIMIFDEPTSGLDFRHMEEVAKVLGKLQKAGKTLFIITHDPELIERCCDYFIFIENGEVSWHGGWNLQNKQQLELFFGPQRKRR